MTTSPAGRIIPAVTLALALLAMSSCGSDENDSSATTAVAATALSSSSSAATQTTTAASTAPTASSTTATTATSPAAEAAATTTLTAAATTAPPEAPTTTAPDGAVAISVTVGTDSGPDRIEEIPLGSPVTLTLVDPNAAQEYHVHGYELGDGVHLEPGEPAVFTFTADKPGDFEIESHEAETVLVVLRVS